MAELLGASLEIDKDAHEFALGLIERWVSDPSNVRLLRIGLDLWPDVEILKGVVELLRPFTENSGRRKAPRRVAWYCLAEILKAGATETGLVEDKESLPQAIDLNEYRRFLRDEAARLVGLPSAQIPWYLRQQALCFLAVFAPHAAPVVHAGRSAETRHYREMIKFLRGEGARLRSADFATLAVLSRRAFSDKNNSIKLTLQALTPARKRAIAARDPSFFLEFPARIREDLCLETLENGGDRRSLSEIVLQDGHPSLLRNELELLRFAYAFLKKLRVAPRAVEVITPGQVRLKLRPKTGIPDVKELAIVAGRAAPTGSLYRPPAWCHKTARWRFQLGFLLRFILAGRPDFTRIVRPPHWKETERAYRPGESHWYQRLYGLFNSQPAFGDDWLPITDWMEGFLSALLHWPGCRYPNGFDLR